MTPFGVPVEPDVNRNFAMVSGDTRVARTIDLRRRRRSDEGSEWRHAAGRSEIRRARHDLGVAVMHGVERAREAVAFGREDQAGCQ